MDMSTVMFCVSLCKALTLKIGQSRVLIRKVGNRVVGTFRSN